jgi:hypothetical protein
LVEHPQHLDVEVYPHGGWWKDSRGRTGQVPQAQARKGALATVAVLSNSYGTAGWTLTEVISAQHNSYRLSFEKASAIDPAADEADSPSDKDHPAIPLG